MIPWTNGSAGGDPSTSPGKAGCWRGRGRRRWSSSRGAAKCGKFLFHIIWAALRTLGVLFSATHLLERRKVLLTLYACILIYRHSKPPL